MKELRKVRRDTRGYILELISIVVVCSGKFVR